LGALQEADASGWIFRMLERIVEGDEQIKKRITVSIQSRCIIIQHSGHRYPTGGYSLQG
jgi:hypothetical protein